MAWLPKTSVVVPVDFSSESLEAVVLALELVAAPTALHLVHVLPALEPTEPGVIWSTIDNTGRLHHAEQALRQRVDATPAAGAQVAARIGDPGHEIADHAAEVKAELIVLPSHGRTGLARVLLGSTAERVVRLAHCPVLVLRK